MADDADDETPESLREGVEHPMYRLFSEYGKGQRRWFALGVLTSIAARGLALVPPVVLGIAIDSIFRDDVPFNLPLVSAARLPVGTMQQFWLSTVRDADRIVVVEDGRIVERGTHDELLDEDGLYANLWRVQAGEIDELPEAFVADARSRAAEKS